ncbi:recombinase family protein [Haloferax mediterranei ATCC 33500]|uniref:Recombinase family protein n=1 Tax=Haloferax mediterranei (strain ATCC 33500 / DSM 1411 / JCM 8866 / NBRC 14739 / NCIMB 2177 / R-4) TaxID=523841 RepID=I3R333_HALMT|nr:recombinase family protein [Haloferax mediterranei]AFK18643.1 resolvase [Haloferax mediterranei ATCC 33500]AHZ21984.1 resolvase [Haloferax mediterranei ATCC 33500]EMA02080.1 resolvase [Haloferax mediterranei ATCC 33500]MDX5988737.1 recombinase family protein [Haloferax mediterranei ATCC 33500]QCQ75144.1 recombinase family protein [Haloferax mediterranei ATCC 33500]
MIACYTRVSTEDQNLDRQIDATQKYAQRTFDVGLDELEVYRDKSTGTDTNRSAYKRMMSDVEAGAVDAVVVNSISRIARSIRDLDRTAERIGDCGAELHIISEGFALRPDDDDPYQRAMFQLLGVFSELEARMAQQRTKEGIAVRKQNEEYHHGPAPLGFEKDDGLLAEGENYDQVCAVLEMVTKENLSKRKAAKELQTSRATVDRCLDRGTLYGL